MARVRIHPDVLASLKEQREWIAEHRDDGWAERLQQDLDEALAALTSSRGSGRPPRLASGEPVAARR